MIKPALLSCLFLLLSPSPCEGQSQLIGPPQPIVAKLGDDIILPSHLDPAVDVIDMIVEWTRPDLDHRLVLLWRQGWELEHKKHPSYKGRTSLSLGKLVNGDVSLKLSEVKLSDEGKYRCFIPSLGRESMVELVVGAASSPVINMSKSSSGVVLECESKGWYPEPELFWLDAEGKLLSAGAPETVRGPDGLYTVSSRVTVKKRHGNSFTCRVQQLSINQSRDTHIHVPDDFFSASPADPFTIGLFVVFLSVALLPFVAVVYVVWQLKHIKIKRKREGSKTKFQRNNVELQFLTEEGRNPEQLKTERKTLKDLDKKKAKLEEELQKKKEERKHLVVECDKLMRHKIELEKNSEENKLNLEKTERQWDENQKKLQSVRRKIHEQERDKTDLKKQKDKAKKNKDEDLSFLLTAQNKLKWTKSHLAKQLQEEEKKLEYKEIELTAATEKKKVAESQMEKIRVKLKELKEVEKQRKEREGKTQAEEQQKGKALESQKRETENQEEPQEKDQLTEGRAEAKERLEREEEERKKKEKRDSKKGKNTNVFSVMGSHFTLF